MENIKLSESELEMIKINRQKAELETQEAATKKKISDEKRIADCKKEIEKFKIKWQEQNHAVSLFWEELNKTYPGLYEIKSSPRTELHKAYNWKKDEDDEILYIENTAYDYQSIVRTDVKNNDEINVKFYTAGESYSSKRVSEYRMFIGYESKALKNVKTVHDKIQGEIDQFRRKKSETEISEEGWEKCLQDIKQLLPEAEVKKEEKWIGDGYGRNRGYSSKRVVAEFKNGLTVTYTYNYFLKDNTMVYQRHAGSINSSKLDNSKVIEALKNL